MDEQSTARPSVSLDEALFEQVREIAPADEQRQSGLGSNAPEIDFLAVVCKARRHVAARRGELPELQ